MSKDHQLFLRHMLGMIETGDMFHGRFVEVHVGRLLGADIADTGTNGWDLRIPGDRPVTVEVKAAAEGRQYRISPKDADVWVFVTFADKTKGPDGFRYAVAGRQALGDLPSRVSQKRIFDDFNETTASGLRAAVIEAAAPTVAETTVRRRGR